MNKMYYQRPMRCSREFRNLVVERFPLLTSYPDGHAYMKMLQFVLWSTMTDRDTGKLLMPFGTVADLVGIHPHNKRFRAAEWIAAFSRDVFPLNPTEYRYMDRRARCIDPHVPVDILDALRADRQNDNRKDWLWFTDGSSVTRRRLQQTVRDEEDAIIGIARVAVKDHPAGELMDYLVTQPQDCLQRVLARNWPLVKEAIYRLPRETPKQIATANWSERVLDNLHERRTIYYGAACKSPRLYAIGTTVHLLPRRLRQIALTGGVELDLKAAQLAIVSQLWGVPSLRDFLADPEKSIWDELLNWMGVALEYKPILKIVIYAIVFGMTQGEVRDTLTDGTDKEEGVGAAATARFFRHALVQDVLAARSRVLQVMKEERQAVDAFGRKVKVVWDHEKNRLNVPSVAAQVVQSWEVRLMLSLVPVLRAERQLYCLSFLHDGLTVWCGDETKWKRHIRKLKSAVQAEADRWGIPTWLEDKPLRGEEG